MWKFGRSGFPDVTGNPKPGSATALGMSFQVVSYNVEEVRLRASFAAGLVLSFTSFEFRNVLSVAQHAMQCLAAIHHSNLVNLLHCYRSSAAEPPEEPAILPVNHLTALTHLVDPRFDQYPFEDSTRYKQLELQRNADELKFDASMGLNIRLLGDCTRIFC